MTNNNNNNANNPVKLQTYRRSYIVAGVIFAVIFILCMALLSLVTYQASGVVLYFAQSIAVIAALIIAGIASVRCASANKIKNPVDIFIPKRDTAYYFKRIAFITLMIFLMSLAASLVGLFVNSILAIVFIRVQNEILSVFLMRLPIFVLYLALVYKMLVRFGFMDAQRKIFNPGIKTIAFILAFLVMLPALAYENYIYASPYVTDGLVNTQAVFSVHEGGVYIVEDIAYPPILNEDFGAVNVILIGISILITFAAQFFFFRFAYKRGKKIFIKQHIREVDEYAMDENI